MLNLQLPSGNLIKMFNRLISLINNPDIFKGTSKNGCCNEGNSRPAHKFIPTDIQYVPEQSHL